MEHKLYDLSKLQEIAQGDEAFVKDMLISFVDNVSSDIEQVQSLRQTENWKTIAEIAHRLASRFAYLIINDLQNLSVDIEKSVFAGNMTGIFEKTNRLCLKTISLIEQMKKDFNFL